MRAAGGTKGAIMAVDQEKQMREAEEILGDRLQSIGFAKGLFFGQFLGEQLPAYPVPHDSDAVDNRVEQLREFCQQRVDPIAIDREARIPDEVVQGLGELGVLGACLPPEVGGLGLSQAEYCRLLEVLGGHCGSTALFVNAHHSIGPRAIVLFGNPEQKSKYLPQLATGEWISAFALTEPEAGSDAANVQTTATPTDDGKGFLLNGQKRWITNGGIAQVLTVMARTPVPGSKETKITAFIVTPDMPGFQVVETRMEKLGVRGTATSRLAFENMFVPRENILGQLGKGLRVALTVLDFGRTTFGASCTGAAKFCVAGAAAHANQRVQFEKSLGEFELVKEKLAHMEAGAFAMEACTYQTAAIIDAAVGDFMLETAMLKVFSTDVLWRIINDTFQIHGGMAYFTDEPWERMLRDARINMIGEGANDVLRAFIALVGMRDVGLEMEGVLDALLNPFGKRIAKLGRFAGRELGTLLVGPAIAVRDPQFERPAERLSRTLKSFGASVKRLLATYQKEILDRQYQLARASDVVTEIYVSVCVLRRMETIIRDHHGDDAAKARLLATGNYYLQTAERRMRQNLAAMWDNDDAETTEVANRLLRAR
jgi:alkylation response protein AidB-like acyl-CoA dehydrogenase